MYQKKTQLPTDRLKNKWSLIKAFFSASEKILAQVLFSSSHPEGSYVHWKNINCIKLKHTNIDIPMLQSTGETVTSSDNWAPEEFSKEKQWLPLVQELWIRTSSVCWQEWEPALEEKSLHCPTVADRPSLEPCLGITELSLVVCDSGTAGRF